MRLFLDTSVLLAASASSTGASRLIFRTAISNEWVLVVTPQVLEEILHNLPTLPLEVTSAWSHLRPRVVIHDDVLTIDRPSVFPATKDRPVLFGALAWADVLLTLDRRDFKALLGKEFYGLPVLTPGMFVQRERKAGRLEKP